MDTRKGGCGSIMIWTVLFCLFAVSLGEQEDLLGSLANLALTDPLVSGGGLFSGGGLQDVNLGASKVDTDPLSFLNPMSGDSDKLMEVQDSLRKPLSSGLGLPVPLGFPKGTGKPGLGLPVPLGFTRGIGKPGFGLPLPKGKMLKTAAIPLKKIALKKMVAAKVMVPKAKTLAALKLKPKVYKLKPIVHIVEKPVPVFHKVPVPKKVLVPKFYKVMKPIPFPKIVPVPFKVPIKKIIPKIVKIPKAVPIPKFVPVKKYIPIGIPYPVPKFYKVPVPKPMPYKKYIPIPIPKKVPKFIPVPVKKIIKVPKPYYVPIKVPYVTTSFMKTPMEVDVPNIKKPAFGFGSFSQPLKGGKQQQVNFIPSESKDFFKVEDSNTAKGFGKVPSKPH